MKKKFIKRKKEIKKNRKKLYATVWVKIEFNFFDLDFWSLAWQFFSSSLLSPMTTVCVCVCVRFSSKLIGIIQKSTRRTHTESLRNESKNQELILKTTKQQQTNSHWLINKLAEWKYCKRNNPENKNDSFFIAIAQFIVNFEMNQQQQQQKKKTKIYILHLIMSPVVFSIFKDPEPKRNHHYLALKKQRHD